MITSSIDQMQNQYEQLNREADFQSSDITPHDIFTGFGSYRERMADRAQQKAADVFNQMEAMKQREFEQMMDNTKYQRAAKDLAAIGFSPLALLSSSPGSAPSGSAASYSSGAKTRQKTKSGASELAALAIRVLGLIMLKG